MGGGVILPIVFLQCSNIIINFNLCPKLGVSTVTPLLPPPTPTVSCRPNVSCHVTSEGDLSAGGGPCRTFFSFSVGKNPQKVLFPHRGLPSCVTWPPPLPHQARIQDFLKGGGGVIGGDRPCRRKITIWTHNFQLQGGGGGVITPTPPPCIRHCPPSFKKPRILTTPMKCHWWRQSLCGIQAYSLKAHVHYSLSRFSWRTSNGRLT